MAKRFVDTELFKDEWFIELSSEGKLFWLYYITNCDHAGVLKFSVKHIKFCTGIKDLTSVINEFSNRLVTVREGLFWMPNFIKFQYPNFPDTKMKAALSALDIISKLGIDLNSYETVKQLFPNGYSNGIGNSNGKNGGCGGNLIEDRKKVFATDLAQFSEKNGGQYPSEMVKAFFSYWTEKNKSGSKMRFELEKTWETKKRLTTWANREIITNKKINGNGTEKLGTSAARTAAVKDWGFAGFTEAMPEKANDKSGDQGLQLTIT